MSFLTVAMDKSTFSFILVSISFHLSIVPIVVCFHDFSTVHNSSIFGKQVPNNLKFAYGSSVQFHYTAHLVVACSNMCMSCMKSFQLKINVKL